METSHNNATNNRPSGDRYIDNKMLHMDLEKSIALLRQEVAWQKNDHSAITLFKTTGITVVLIGLHHNSLIKPNSDDGVITLQVLKGNIELNAEDKVSALPQGHVMALHKGVSYSILAVEESFCLLTICI